MSAREHEMRSPYEYEFDPNDLRTTAAKVYQLAREGGPRILDLGSGPAIVSSRLRRDEGKMVTCLDGDEDLLAVARERGIERTLVADLDSPSWADQLKGETFDVIILADVLEHLRRPGAVLNLVRERALLDEDGYFVISIPNAAHEAILAELLAGDLTYREAGLLDATHIRFFTLETFTALCEAHGFCVTRLLRTCYSLEETELAARIHDLPPAVRLQVARSTPESKTYQFVARVEPMGNAVRIELATARATLEDARARTDELEAELRRERVGHGDEIARMKTEFDQGLREARRVAQRARAKLDEVRGTLTWRVYARIRRIGAMVLRRRSGRER